GFARPRPGPGRARPGAGDDEPPAPPGGVGPGRRAATGAARADRDRPPGHHPRRGRRPGAVDRHLHAEPAPPAGPAGDAAGPADRVQDGPDDRRPGGDRRPARPRKEGARCSGKWRSTRRPAVTAKPSAWPTSTTCSRTRGGAATSSPATPTATCSKA